jgi:LuxR family maltose regulon positive regulatory protein
VAIGSDLQAVALLNLGVTEAWSLRLADSERHLMEGAALAHEIGRPYLEVACLAHLGFAATGDTLARARRHCQDAIALAARHGWDNAPVIAPAYATLAAILIWTGEFDHGEQWLERARRATPPAGEPGMQLFLHLISAILPAARGQHEAAMVELLAAGRVQALMVGQHALTCQVIAWTIATQARLGDLEQARATLAAVDARLADTGEIRNAAAMLLLAEKDPEAARRELEAVLDGSTTVTPALTLIEAQLLDALASRELGDERASMTAVERALQLAEPERLILPFAMTGAWELLEALPAHGTAHAALITDILDALRVGGPERRIVAEPAGRLSPSELRVLRYLPTNLTRPEIAGQLSVSVNTVNTHVRRIYSKLGATDRSSAVRRGRELRLLSSGRAALS